MLFWVASPALRRFSKRCRDDEIRLRDDAPDGASHHLPQPPRTKLLASGRPGPPREPRYAARPPQKAGLPPPGAFPSFLKGMATVTNARPTRQARAEEEAAAIARAPTSTRTFLDIDLDQASLEIDVGRLCVAGVMAFSLHKKQACVLEAQRAGCRWPPPFCLAVLPQVPRLAPDRRSPPPEARLCAPPRDHKNIIFCDEELVVEWAQGDHLQIDMLRHVLARKGHHMDEYHLIRHAARPHSTYPSRHSRPVTSGAHGSPAFRPAPPYCAPQLTLTVQNIVDAGCFAIVCVF